MTRDKNKYLKTIPPRPYFFARLRKKTTRSTVFLGLNYVRYRYYS